MIISYGKHQGNCCWPAFQRGMYGNLFLKSFKSHTQKLSDYLQSWSNPKIWIPAPRSEPVLDVSGDRGQASRGWRLERKYTEKICHSRARGNPESSRELLPQSTSALEITRNNYSCCKSSETIKRMVSWTPFCFSMPWRLYSFTQ